jgi:lipoyl(octanoyl) transferase
MTQQDAIIRRLGITAYEPVLQDMQTFTRDRQAETVDEIWLTQHQPVFTQGQAGKAEHVLFPGDIPVVQSDRGGQVTYHGPGQITAYLLFDLRRLGIGVRDLVCGIERAMLQTLTAFGVEGYARQDAPGVYVGNDKVGSLGLRVRRGRSYHGLSLNVDMDLEPFSRINPCGLSDIGVTQLSNLCKADFSGTEAVLLKAIAEQFKLDLSKPDNR